MKLQTIFGSLALILGLSATAQAGDPAAAEEHANNEHADAAEEHAGNKEAVESARANTENSAENAAAAEEHADNEHADAAEEHAEAVEEAKGSKAERTSSGAMEAEETDE